MTKTRKPKNTEPKPKPTGFPKVVKHPGELTREELMVIIGQVQDIFYIDRADRTNDPNLPEGIEDGELFWDPDKEWDIGWMELIADLLDDYGLVPKAVAPARGENG